MFKPSTGESERRLQAYLDEEMSIDERRQFELELDSSADLKSRLNAKSAVDSALGDALRTALAINEGSDRLWSKIEAGILQQSAASKVAVESAPFGLNGFFESLWQKITFKPALSFGGVAAVAIFGLLVTSRTGGSDVPTIVAVNQAGEQITTSATEEAAQNKTDLYEVALDDIFGADNTQSNVSEASANVGVDILAKVGIAELPTGDILARNEEATVQGELFPSAEIALVSFQVQPQLEVALQDKRLDFDRVRPQPTFGLGSSFDLDPSTSAAPSVRLQPTSLKNLQTIE